MLRKGLLLFAVLLLLGCGGGGGSSEEPSSTPTLKTSTLKVVSISPADEAIDVAVNTGISAEFNEEIDPASVDPSGANFKVVQNGINVNGTVSQVGRIVTFTPLVNYAANTTCAVALTGLKSKSGDAMEEKIWSFTTDFIPDTTPPSVIASSPLNGAVVAVNATVSATFDEPIDPSSLNSDIFAVTNTDTNLAVNGTLTLDSAGTKIIFTPSANLDFSSHYAVKILGVKDLTGNAIATASIWNFSTVAAPVVTTVNLATADWVTYSKGGVTQATFDKVAGIVTVNVASASTDVSVRWAPLNVVAGKTYHVSFPCSSVPQQNAEVQLKENGGTYHIYSTAMVACTGTVTVDMVPDRDDPLGRLNINFGGATGIYTVDTVKVEY